MLLMTFHDSILSKSGASTKPGAIHPDYITKRFTKDVTEAGVSRITLHGLRHTFATTALGEGQNPRNVSDMLGHENIKTTLDVYSQYIRGAHVLVVEAVEAKMFGTKESGPA